jgi:enoyl-CoA hydratase/carnithine racemase
MSDKLSAQAAAKAGELVLSRDDGRVRVLTLNRPNARNALDAALRLELIAHLHEAENDGSVGAVVITGAGNAFAAGADLKELLARSSGEQREFLTPPHIYSVIEELRKPVVAAINGHALGAGLELATACDLRVCAAEARLGQPEIAFALLPGGGGTQRLVRMLGRGQAARLVLTGEPLTAQEAERTGLVEWVVPREQVLPKALEVAASVARHDPGALAEAKRALHAAMGEGYAKGLGTEIDAFVRLHARDEARARIRDFLEEPK